MAYRESTIEGACEFCEDLTDSRCPSCRRLCCAVHVRDDMCRFCREALAAHLARDPRSWIDFVTIYPLSVGVMTAGLLWFPLLFVGLGIFFLGPGKLSRVRHRRRELALRAQLRERGRLPPPPGADADAQRIALAEYDYKLAHRERPTVSDADDD